MARVSTYLNFPRTTEEAFTFYQSVFGGEFVGGISRQERAPQIAGEDHKLVMYLVLRILGGQMLMGTDAPESMGFSVANGNNVYINLEPDTREETERLFEMLSQEGKVEMPLQDMFWGAYYGSCTDKYGIQWMFNYADQG